MQFPKTILCVLSALLLTALTTVPSTEAVMRQSFHGSSCKNTLPGDATNVIYTLGLFSPITGIGNAGASLMSVICPLINTQNNNLDVTVGIYLVHSGTRTTTCSAYMSDSDGSVEVSDGGSVTGSGLQYMLLDISGGAGSIIHVRCGLPGNSKVMLTRIELTESED